VPHRTLVWCPAAFSPDHLNSAKAGELQQLENSYLRRDRYVSSDLATEVPLAGNGAERADPSRVSAGAAWLADGGRIRGRQ
jgi:hypothetical protein